MKSLLGLLSMFLMLGLMTTAYAEDDLEELSDEAVVSDSANDKKLDSASTATASSKKVDDEIETEEDDSEEEEEEIEEEDEEDDEEEEKEDKGKEEKITAPAKSKPVEKDVKAKK